MIEKKLITAITVYDVAGIDVQAVDGPPTEEFEGQNACSRCLRVYTAGGDELELRLFADADTKLELKETDWLAPKLYKGKGKSKNE